MSGQSKVGSLVESLMNIAIGFGVNLAANLVVLPHFGFNVTVRDALGIGVIFTIISIVRSYVLRRLFNRITQSGFSLRNLFRRQ